MSAIREALGQRDLLRCRFDEWWEAVGEDGDLAKMAKHRDDCPNCVMREAALAELGAMERELDWLRTELGYLQDRGDSVVYRDEREAFDRWQRKAPAMERVVEAARREASSSDHWPFVRACECDLCAALAELDGQEEGGPSHAVEPHGGARQACEPSDRAVPPSSCPCRVHGDPDGDCGENCG